MKVGEVWTSSLSSSLTNGGMLVLEVDEEKDLVICVALTNVKVEKLSAMRLDLRKTPFSMRSGHRLAKMVKGSEGKTAQGPEGTGKKGKYDSIIKTACADGWMTVKAMQYGSKVLMALPPSAVSTRCKRLWEEGILDRKLRPDRPVGGLHREFEYMLHEDVKDVEEVTP